MLGIDGDDVDDDDDDNVGGEDDDGIVTDTSSIVDGLFCRRISTVSNRIIVIGSRLMV